MPTITINLRQDKSLQKKARKFRLLLDSAFAQPDSFPKLKKKANLTHSVHDLGLSPQAEDEEIYQRAVEENRFVLTVNFRHFKKLVKIGKPGVIGINSYLSNAQIDNIVTEFISREDPDTLLGKAIKI